MNPTAAGRTTMDRPGPEPSGRRPGLAEPRQPTANRRRHAATPRARQRGIGTLRVMVHRGRRQPGAAIPIVPEIVNVEDGRVAEIRGAGGTPAADR